MESSKLGTHNLLKAHLPSQRLIFQQRWWQRGKQVFLVRFELEVIAANVLINCESSCMSLLQRFLLLVY